jgi:hypothetical protein
MGTDKDVMDLLAFVGSCDDALRVQSVLMSRFGVLTIREARRRGYLDRTGHKLWARPDDQYALTAAGRIAVCAALAAE